MAENTPVELAELLQRLVDELDVPPGKYREAQERYDAVAEWLNESDSKVAQYHPTIYPQGSFRLGTVIRPLGDEEYDVDAVCLLHVKSPDQTTQQQVKNLVGERLKEKERYRQMLTPPEGSRRCWTLQYSEASKFHLDVLPAIPDPDRSLQGKVPPKRLETAIYVTDKTTWNGPERWPKGNRSNPKGYADWFRERMQGAFERRRQAILNERSVKGSMQQRGKVEELPDYEVRTPLQQVIQLLKRHRDKKYNGDEDKPISIIITTLAAKAYNNEDDLAEALLNIVPQMRNGIETRDGVYWVPNPVNPYENFADKWAESTCKAKLFFEWLTALEEEHESLLTAEGFARAGDYLKDAYGDRDAGAALTKFAKAKPTSSAVVLSESAVPSRFRVAHREPPRWPLSRQFSVTLAAQWKREGGSWQPLENDSRALPKGLSLHFQAQTNVPGDFAVYWQVVNTGMEAKAAGSLRGDIFPAKTAGRGGINQTEDTGYSGMHWITCYIVIDGVCVAHSAEFVVNIA